MHTEHAEVSLQHILPSMLSACIPHVTREAIATLGQNNIWMIERYHQTKIVNCHQHIAEMRERVREIQRSMSGVQLEVPDNLKPTRLRDVFKRKRVVHDTTTKFPDPTRALKYAIKQYRDCLQEEQQYLDYLSKLEVEMQPKSKPIFPQWRQLGHFNIGDHVLCLTPETEFMGTGPHGEEQRFMFKEQLLQGKIISSWGAPRYLTVEFAGLVSDGKDPCIEYDLFSPLIMRLEEAKYLQQDLTYYRLWLKVADHLSVSKSDHDQMVNLLCQRDLDGQFLHIATCTPIT